MLAPIFTHGTLNNTIKAIQDGKIKYPAYCWLTDVDQYGFLNKNNKLETIGIPELRGTLDNVLILSTLYDGLYQVRGQHKITADHPTTYDCASNIIVIVQTIDGIKRIRRITAEEMTAYTIEEDLSVTENVVATKEYLEQNKYMTEPEVDIKIAVMKAEIVAIIDDVVDEAIRYRVRPIVEEVVDETILPIDNEDVSDLFNN